MKKIKKVSNPLTIVAIFAGIAEVAGTTVLPCLSIELQNIFIWYVMLFPIILVLLFFITWNFNSKVLYSPNDFSDENNYMESLKMFYNIKQTVKNGKEKGEEDKEIIEKVYNSVETGMQKIDRIKNEIIELLSEEPEGMSLPDICARISMSMAIVRRKLAQLEEAGIIERDWSILKTEDSVVRRTYIFKLKK